MSKEEPKYQKSITYMGKPVVVYCDGKCDKAWGFISRPRYKDNWIPDDELGEAPEDPGTIEGEDSKPLHDQEKMNKWCIRQCERSNFINIGEGG